MSTKYTRGNPPPANLGGGGWIFSSASLPRTGQLIEYLNSVGEVRKAEVLRSTDYRCVIRQIKSTGENGNEFNFGPNYSRCYWRLPKQDTGSQSDPGDWIIDRLPVVGERVVVSIPWEGYSAHGVIIQHKENCSRTVVFCPDDYPNRAEGYFIRLNGKGWKPEWQVPTAQFETAQEGDEMFVPVFVQTIGGYRGQVKNNNDSKVVWESKKVFTDVVNDKDVVTKTGAQLAQEAANDKINEIISNLFKA